MSRRAMYIETIESLPEPATLTEIQHQAIMLFGAKAHMSSVKSSVERFVMLGRLIKMQDADGVTRYWIPDRPIGVREHLNYRIRKLKRELESLERQLAAIDDINPFSPPQTYADRLSKAFQQTA